MRSRNVDDLRSADAWLSYFEKGGTIQHLRNVDDDYLALVYRYAHNQFCSGHFETAVKVFRYLALMNHNDSRYFLGIGWSLYKMDKIRPAISMLNHANLLNKNDPRPLLALVKCFILLKNRKEALKTLSEAFKRIGLNHQWRGEKKIANQLKAYLKNND